MARLHRAAIRLHLTDLAGFEADHAEARRLAVSLSGPEVRPHVLWQAGGLAWLRGNAARAEELTTEAYELYRRVTPHARHAYAAHQFTLRRADGRLGETIPLLVETGDEGSPLLQEMAVLAAAESGDLGRGPAAAGAVGPHADPRLGQRRRRPPAGGVGAVAGRRAGVGLGGGGRCSPTAGGRRCSGRRPCSLGAYDELLGRIAERRGDLAAAREWWQSAREQGVLVGSPHQVALADAHLARVPAVPAPRRRLRPGTTPDLLTAYRRLDEVTRPSADGVASAVPRARAAGMVSRCGRPAGQAVVAMPPSTGMTAPVT